MQPLPGCYRRAPSAAWRRRLSSAAVRRRAPDRGCGRTGQRSRMKSPPIVDRLDTCALERRGGTRTYVQECRVRTAYRARVVLETRAGVATRLVLGSDASAPPERLAATDAFAEEVRHLVFGLSATTQAPGRQPGRGRLGALMGWGCAGHREGHRSPNIRRSGRRNPARGAGRRSSTPAAPAPRRGLHRCAGGWTMQRVPCNDRRRYGERNRSLHR